MVFSTFSSIKNAVAKIRRNGIVNALEVYCIRGVNPPKPQSHVGAIRIVVSEFLVNNQKQTPAAHTAPIKINGAEYEAFCVATGASENNDNEA